MGYHPDRKRRALYDHKWERASKAFLAEYPWCNDCGKIATEVHHKQKHRGDHGLFWDETNWMPLCHRCHSKRTGRGE
jgi:5-methylcytosine-specific restriction endonuclease McrA